jgi:predicted metal-dependent peptidase
MPGLYGEEYADMYFVMDTSGSVSDDDRAILTSELRRILEDYNVAIHLIYCDTRVHGDPIRLTREDIQNGHLSLELKGYGGTDFRPAFKYINDHMDEVTPELVIYLTDMYPNTWSLGDEPPYSVFWACLPQGQRDAKPPWGQVVQIELEGRK